MRAFGHGCVRDPPYVWPYFCLSQCHSPTYFTNSTHIIYPPTSSTPANCTHILYPLTSPSHLLCTHLLYPPTLSHCTYILHQQDLHNLPCHFIHTHLHSPTHFTMSIPMSVCPYFCPYVCLSLCLSVCLSLCLSVCPYVCLSGPLPPTHLLCTHILTLPLRPHTHPHTLPRAFTNSTHIIYPPIS